MNEYYDMTFEDALTEFAKRDTAGFLVWGTKLNTAHKREVAAKDAEIGKLRECLREAVEWSCGNPDENCKDCVAHGGDTPCKCETWRKMLEGGV